MRFFASNGSVGLEGYDIHEVGDDGVGRRVLTLYVPGPATQTDKDRALYAASLIVADLNYPSPAADEPLRPEDAVRPDSFGLATA